VSYTLRPHTADVAVEATGGSLSETMAAVADGLAAACCDAIPDGGDRFGVDVTAGSREALLYEYCAELIYQRDARGVLPVDNAAGIVHDDGWRLHASARGVTLDRIDAREVKAVTYSDMAVERTRSGWRAYVVFDV
jgi:SHS2 domain-containing protein